MNIVFVSEDSREAELLNSELSKQAPAIRVDISPNTQHALFCYVVPGNPDVILLDESVPSSDAVNLIVTIRNENKQIGIVALVGAQETELPIELYYAGVDRFIVKREGYTTPLLDALQEAKERRRSEPASHPRQARLFYAGDIDTAKYYLSRLPYMIMEPLGLAPDGALQMPDLAAFPGDVIVLDSALTESRTLEAIKEIIRLAPDISVILLADWGDENIAVQAMQAGAADCIAKTANYFERLLPAIEREFGRRQLAREQTAHRAREDRLRQILEIMPVGIAVIAPDGSFIAANRLGLKLMGATRVEQIVGKNLNQMVSEEERQRTSDFLATIAGWASASIRLNWKGPDGTGSGFEFRAVPMRRETIGTAAALAAIYPDTAAPDIRQIVEEPIRKDSHEYELRFRQLQERYSLQQSQLEAALQQAHSRCAAAEELQKKFKRATESTAARLKLLVEEQRSAQKNWRQSYDELKVQYEKLEATNQSLRSEQVELVDTRSAGESQWELEREELESKCQAAIEQAAELQAALRNAEAGLEQLSEKHNVELSQRDFAQRKAEKKFQAAEKQRLTLEESLRDAESNMALLSGMRAQWDLDRLEMEQKYQDAEKQHAIDLQNAVREAESRLAWISEQNEDKAAQLEKIQQETDQLKADCRRLSAESADFRQRFQRLSQCTAAGIVLARRDGQVVECNDIAARMFGYAGAGEALSPTGANPFRIYAFEGALDALLQQDGKLENIEWSALSRDGQIIRIQENATLVENPEGGSPFVERILTDVSNIYRIREEIRRARGTESARDLAVAAVTGFKDLCTSLVQYCQQLTQTPDDRNEVQHIAETLMKDGNRGIKHALQFLSVAQKTERTPALLNINEILSNNDAQLRSHAGEGIDLQIVRAQQIGLVSADRNEMDQLIGSLLENSRESLPLGGVITIETSNIEIDGSAAGQPAPLRPGIYVRITVSSDGCAIQPEKRTASAKIIVERMGGYLETTSDPKLGNTDRVYLPRVEAFPRHSEVLSNAAGA